jgi:hypothetical protein
MGQEHIGCEITRRESMQNTMYRQHHTHRLTTVNYYVCLLQAGIAFAVVSWRPGKKRGSPGDITKESLLKGE